jgi:hypothetical protein
MHAFRHGRVSHMQANMMPGDFLKNQIGHSGLRVTRSTRTFSTSKSGIWQSDCCSVLKTGSLYSLPN